MAVEVLSAYGLSLEFFTLAVRFLEYPHTYAVQECHLRVRAKPETVSKKM
jgi:hypothetical protein